MFLSLTITLLLSHSLPLHLLPLHCNPLPLSEINLKEQLVDQLEKAQTNLHVMRQQYEEKMSLLQTQIKNIESERDKVLKDIGKWACTLHIPGELGCYGTRLKDIRIYIIFIQNLFLPVHTSRPMRLNSIKSTQFINTL